MTSKVRSIYVNSVIVVSRNLVRIYEAGGKKNTHYFSFHSSSVDKVVKFLRKEHFFYSVFNSVLLNLILDPAIVGRSLRSVHVREIVVVA